MITSVREWEYLTIINSPLKDVEKYLSQLSKDLLKRNSELVSGDFSLVFGTPIGTWHKSLLKECKDIENLYTQVNKDYLWFKQYFKAVRLYACSYEEIVQCLPENLKVTNLTFNDERYPMMFTKEDYINRTKFYEVFDLL